MMDDGEKRAARRWLRERLLTVRSVHPMNKQYDEREFAIVEAWTDQAIARSKQVLESEGFPYRVVGHQVGSRRRGRDPGPVTHRWYIAE